MSMASVSYTHLDVYKRQYLASVGVVGGPVPRDEDIARYSVDTADALLAALEETK